MSRAPRLLPLLAMLLAAPVALAQTPVPVRVGDHAGHGRIVFDWAAPPRYSVQSAPDQLLLRFPAGSAIDLAGARRPPRNILAVTAEPEGIRIALRPGARVRHFRIGPRVVVDVLDPLPERSATAVAAPPVPAARAAAPRPEATPRPPLAPPAAASAVAPQTAPVIAPVLATPRPAVSLPPPTALAARVIVPPGHERTLLLPYGAGTGAAILRRGNQVLALFDSAEPLDLAALRDDPIFGALEAEALPEAMLLRLSLAPPALLRARREATGWLLEAAHPAEARDAAVTEGAMVLEAEGGAMARLAVLAARPGRVVPVTDPETGMPLLLGTVQQAGQRMPITRRLPEFDLPPTLLGLAVLVRADQVTLRAGTDRFLIGTAGGLALDAAAAQPAPGEAMTRSFDFPPGPPAELLERLRTLNASIAAAAPLTRREDRRAAAEALLALGMPQEAQAMLRLAQSEDPQAAADPRLAALAGVAALLAGRVPEAMALRATTLLETDELTLWRAALAAALGEVQAAAPGLTATLPLLFAYPEALRGRLLPPVALALAEARATAPLKQLLDSAGQAPDLALARAMLAEAEGDTEAALKGYDQVAQGRDRQARARALRQAVELRLATKWLDAAAAARALESALFAWRGDAEEFAARQRVAALKREAGDARGALVLLRETETLFPDRAPALRPTIESTFLAALGQEPPLSAITLFDANPELLPANAEGEAAVLLLVDRLAALELGGRAAALLGQAVERAAGPARAAFGLRQAALRFGEGDAAGTLAALAASTATPLPGSLQQQRAVLAARAEAQIGRTESAITTLQALGAAGAEPLSQLLADRQDWPRAAAALAEHLRATLPVAPAPIEDSHQHLLLRQAAMLVLAGNDAGLAALRREHATRFPPGPLAEAFALLTAGQLRGLANLPRLQQELQLFRNMPSRLEALREGGPVTR